MFNLRRFVACLFAAFLGTPLFSQNLPAPVDSSSLIRINVVASAKSKELVTDLQQSDFTLADNKTPRPITSFKAVSSTQQPPHMYILMDAINLEYTRVASVRQELLKFLKENDGHLAHPTTIGVVTDRGIQIPNPFTTDGNALATWLASYTISFRDINNSAGYWGAVDRMQMSISSLNQLLVSNAGKPGRTILVWISPGWPLLSSPGIQPGANLQAQIFTNIENFSTRMRQANTTVYQINPLGATEAVTTANAWELFLKGVAKPKDSDYGDLSLQVLASQSGGLVLHDGNNVAGMLDHCSSDVDFHYEITFERGPNELPDSYHHITLKAERPGITVRTNDGYYIQRQP